MMLLCYIFHQCWAMWSNQFTVYTLISFIVFIKVNHQSQSSWTLLTFNPKSIIMNPPYIQPILTSYTHSLYKLLPTIDYWLLPIHMNCYSLKTKTKHLKTKNPKTKPPKIFALCPASFRPAARAPLCHFGLRPALACGSLHSIHNIK